MSTETKPWRGMTELHFAAYWQDLARVKRCVEQGFDVNAKDDSGWTPLIWCIDMSATGVHGVAEAIIDYLVEHGASLDYRDDHYPSIIDFARSRDSMVTKHLEAIIKR